MYSIRSSANSLWLAWHHPQALPEGLAEQALHYSDHVHVPAQPQLLALEIGRSLRCFGGLESLQQQITNDLHALYGAIDQAIAPYPAAALLLSRHQPGSSITDADTWLNVLKQLPIQALALDKTLNQALQGIGMRRVGELLKLPRSSLARRTGPALLAFLDALQGHQVMALNRFHSRQSFRYETEFAQAIHSTNRLQQPITKGLSSLLIWLRGRGLSIESLQLQLCHEKQPNTVLDIGLLEPGRDMTQLLELCQLHLQQQRLIAPVTGLLLESRSCLPWSAEHRSTQTSIEPLLERLQARLGEKAVFGLQLHADHRPEQAWKAAPFTVPKAMTESRATATAARRPIWLVSRPSSCTARIPMPHRLERIETGWWDMRDVRRDYCDATNTKGQHLWVYQDLRAKDQGWQVQGLFA